MAVTRKDNGVYQKNDDVLNYQNKINETEQAKPASYQQSAAVTAAQNAMNQNMAAKPQGYNSQYSAQLDNLLQQITNPEEFNYEFNGDELFKYYADLYTTKGRQASMDAMGQASSLTGGYGNSYAQSVGNQAYNQYLLDLYDKGMDLRDRAYQMYRDKRDDTYNQYNTLSAADAAAYGRYRDDVSDWQAMQDYLAGRYDTEHNYDYNMYRDNVSDWQDLLNYYKDMYTTEYDNDYTNYNDTANRLEDQYQFDAELDYNVTKDNQETAYNLATTMIENGLWPSSELLSAAGISPADANTLISANSSTGGSGGGGGGSKLYYQGLDGRYYEVNEYGELVKDSKGNYKVVTHAEDLPKIYGLVTNDDELPGNTKTGITNLISEQRNAYYTDSNDELTKWRNKH